MSDRGQRTSGGGELDAAARAALVDILAALAADGR